MMNSMELLLGVSILCARHGGSVTSWVRTPRHNKIVGGVENSYHLISMACDVVLDDMVQNPKFEADAKHLGLDPILEGDHYHLQPLGWR
jgi:hypothetical protein